MSEHKSPVDRALELFVFAPLGFALEARRVLPDLVEKGRQQATGQANLAKMIGQMAVQQGQVEASKAIDRAQRQATSALQDLGVMPKPPAEPAGNGSTSPTAAPAATPSPAPAPAPAPEPAPAAASAPARTTSRPAATRTPAPAPKPEPATTNGSRPAPPVADLAIPDYDSLSASQVVPRLAGLAREELEAVRLYEQAHRARKTILNRVAQLQSGA